MAMMAGMAAINPIFGAFGAWATNSTKKKIEAEMKRQNFAVPEGGGIFDLSLGGIVDGIKDLLGLSEEETKKVVTQVGGAGSSTATTDDPPFTVSDSSTAAPTEASKVLGTSEDDSTTDSLANTVAAANAAALQAGTDGQVTSVITNAGTAEQEVFGGTQAEQDYVTSAAAGNKGGLMNKKALNKKARKKYKK